MKSLVDETLTCCSPVSTACFEEVKEGRLADDRLQRLSSCVDSEGGDADLPFDLVPGLLRVQGVLDVKQSVINPWERLTRIFIVTAGRKYDMPGRHEREKKTNVYKKKHVIRQR